MRHTPCAPRRKPTSTGPHCTNGNRGPVDAAVADSYRINCVCVCVCVAVLLSTNMWRARRLGSFSGRIRFGEHVDSSQNWTQNITLGLDPINSSSLQRTDLSLNAFSLPGCFSCSSHCYFIYLRSYFLPVSSLYLPLFSHKFSKL